MQWSERCRHFVFLRTRHVEPCTCFPAIWSPMPFGTQCHIVQHCFVLPADLCCVFDLFFHVSPFHPRCHPPIHLLAHQGHAHDLPSFYGPAPQQPAKPATSMVWPRTAGRAVPFVTWIERDLSSTCSGWRWVGFEWWLEIGHRRPTSGTTHIDAPTFGRSPGFLLTIPPEASQRYDIHKLIVSICF